MKIIYYYDDPPELFEKSIFLAGPSPRRRDVVPSWRPAALKILEELGYDGVVFIPEPKPGTVDSEFDWVLAPKWEHKMLDMSDIVIFWIPRDMDLLDGEPKLPGFTTNVEFGHWINSGKAVVGYPSEAPKNKYLEFMAEKFHVNCHDTLEKTIRTALEAIGSGAARYRGEREVPLFVWRNRSFRNWYHAQIMASNRLDGLKVKWICNPLSNPKLVYMLAVHPNIFIRKENRNKLNEVVVIRPDISSVLLYQKKENPMESLAVLVKEFRSPASNSDCFIRELPSGSSFSNSDPGENALNEVFEETGLRIEKDRLKYHCSRQLAGTVLAHKAFLYSAELSDEEIKFLREQKDIPRGADLDNPTGERVYVEVVTIKEIMYNNLVDWSNLGMILSGLFEKETKQ